MIETLEQLEARHAKEHALRVAELKVADSFNPEEPYFVHLAKHQNSVTFKKPDMRSALALLDFLKAKGGLDSAYVVSNGFTSTLSEHSTDPKLDTESDNSTRIHECVWLDVAFHGTDKHRRYYENELNCFWRGIRVGIKIETPDMFAPKPVQPAIRFIGPGSTVDKMELIPYELSEGHVKYINWGTGDKNSKRCSYYYPGLDIVKAALGGLV